MPDTDPMFAATARVALACICALVLASCSTVPRVPAEPIALAAPPEQPPEPPIVVLDVPVEPAPVFFRAGSDNPAAVAGETLPIQFEYADLWIRIRQGFELPDLQSPEVKSAESWYATRPDYVARMVDRSRRYLYYIVGEIQKRGMPTEVALLPMIESAYNPMAYSRSRASGIWQFIPSTGKHFGLEQTWWLDERRDVVAATGGALDYLQKLYAEFGDWYLALAAYNWGEGSVRRAIAANVKRGLPTDYQSLSMPAETRQYVPKLQAVKNIIRDPEVFGLDLADVPDAPYFAVVRTTRKMDIKKAAELAEMPLDEFLSLNPQHNRPVIAGADETTLLLPYDKAELFAAKLELIDQPMVTWQAYRTRPGETLAQVAARFGMPLETLRTVNGLGARATGVPAGHALLVPSQAPSDATAASLQDVVFTAVPSTRTVFHRVGKGESLASIAVRYDVTQQDIRSWNQGLGTHLSVGQKLRIVSDATPTKSLRSNRKRPAAAGGSRAKSATSPATHPRARSGQVR
ncbi:MAG: transglycosylase SLT domain-containing protein [Betaproteobacteria bacterium]